MVRISESRDRGRQGMGGASGTDHGKQSVVEGNSHSPTPPRVDLKTIDDVRLEMARVYRAMKQGDIPTQDGTRLAYVLSQIGRLIEVHEIERRLEDLENRALQEKGERRP